MDRIIKVPRETCLPKDVIEKAKTILSLDKLIVYPTDTLYGLGTRVTENGLKRVFEVKKRTENKKPPILLSEAHLALKLVLVNELFWKLIEKYWPGPLTIVAPASPYAPTHLRNWGYIGVRLPDNCIARELARIAGGFIVGTSANLTGEPTPSTVQLIYKVFGEKVDLYIDAGPKTGPASTVVLIDNNKVKILREGSIEIDKNFFK